MNNRLLIRWSIVAAVWCFLYAVYRLYYAAGGTIGIFGTPVSMAAWRRVNAVGGLILLCIAILPLILLPLWRTSPRAKRALFALCWILAVGGVQHALIGVAQRVLSLSGNLVMHFPFWKTIDRRQSDLQALLFNEPWFLVEGLLWIAIAWYGGLRESHGRRAWLGSAAIAVMLLTLVGMLSTYGVIGRVIVG
jgi:hypothetical protein